jgi:hypothetical protein
MAVTYRPIKVNTKNKQYVGNVVPYGKVWEPGKKAMALLTNTPLKIGDTELPIGGYTMYLVPEHDKWTLIVSKNTDISAKYDKSKDLVRAPMQTGQLPQPEPTFSVYLAHSAPTECTIRVDLADIRAWTTIQKQ